MSIVSFGLGGDATGMILSRFNLGGFEIIIDIEPTRSGGGGVTNRKLRDDRKVYQDVTFRIIYKEKEWSRKYVWTNELVDAFVRVTSVARKVINTIKILVNGVSNTYKRFRLKR